MLVEKHEDFTMLKAIEVGYFRQQLMVHVKGKQLRRPIYVQSLQSKQRRAH